MVWLGRVLMCLTAVAVSLPVFAGESRFDAIGTPALTHQGQQAETCAKPGNLDPQCGSAAVNIAMDEGSTTSLRLTRQHGWLESPEAILQALRVSQGGVAIKWEKGHCMLVHGEGSARPASDTERLSGLLRATTVYDFSDSNGGAGIWTARPADETGLEPANFCVKYSSWAEGECFRIRMDGQIAEFHETFLTGDLLYSGIVLPGRAYTKCQQMGYDEIVAEIQSMPREAAPNRPAGQSVTEMNEYLRVLKRANVRAAPSIDAAKLTVLNPGDDILVTGKFTNSNWYRVELNDGREGHVFGTLLGDQRPSGGTVAAPSTDETSPPSTPESAPGEEGEWERFLLEIEMFPDSVWSGTSRGCQVRLYLGPFDNEPKFTWSKNCDGQVESETARYGLSPGFAWLDLPLDASLTEQCVLSGNDDGEVRIQGCKYAGEYTNPDRAGMIVAAVEKYRADAPEREAERKKREAESKRYAEEQKRKQAALDKTAYGRRLKKLAGKEFGEAPVPASGQGIVVCSAHWRTGNAAQAGEFPEGSLVNFNATRMAEMEAELGAYGVPDIELERLPWVQRDAYSLFSVFDGIVFYDRNIKRRPHPSGNGTLVIGEMLKASIESFIADAEHDVRCEVMIERKTCLDPKDPNGVFSMPCP